MDQIDRQLLDCAIQHYQETLLYRLHSYTEYNKRLYGEEQKGLIARLENLKKKVWEDEQCI
jgi:hypothetical protein